ncbi:MAG: phospholipase D-like domain-containing protein [Anaerococcus sp.]
MAFVLKKIKTILRIYILYVIVAGFLVFLFDYNSKEYKEKNIVDTSKYYSNKVGPDKIRLIDNRDLGWPIRVNLLQNAKSSVKICNYSIMGGEISDLYYGLILDTADRGVKIDFLINGVMINIYGPRNAKFWALVNHPNINVRIYEPLNLLKPWTINNRMHDKIWIVDGKYAMTGGKNVADKFFVDVEDSKKFMIEMY